jgi:hypothetical protein
LEAPPRVLFKSPMPVEALATRGSDVVFATSDEILRLDGGASKLVASAKWVKNIVANERAIVAASLGIVTVIVDGAEPRTILAGAPSDQIAMRGEELFAGSAVFDLKHGKVHSLGTHGCHFTAYRSLAAGSCVNGLFANVAGTWAQIAGPRARLRRIAADARRLFWLESLTSGETALVWMELPLEYRGE